MIPAPLIPLKQWLYEESFRLNKTFSAVQSYYHKRRCLPVAVWNPRHSVVYVLPGQHLLPTCPSRPQGRPLIHPQLIGLRGSDYTRAYMRMVRSRSEKVRTLSIASPTRSRR